MIPPFTTANPATNGLEPEMPPKTPENTTEKVDHTSPITPENTESQVVELRQQPPKGLEPRTT